MKYIWLLPIALVLVYFLISYNSGSDYSFAITTKTTIITPTTTPTSTPKPVSKLIYLENVPFVAQAPYGNWKDPLEQNGCEEAAATIAVYWARGQSLSKQQMLDDIKAISNYEIKNFGNSVDTSAWDTASRIIQGYYHYSNSRAEIVSTVDQIINWLSEDYLVITPMNGQKILNHNYTAPGPERHMIVIRGYDPKTGDFVTNDAGTRLGENFRYPKDLFFNAIRDYPTGDHQPFINSSSKSAILVWK